MKIIHQPTLVILHLLRKTFGILSKMTDLKIESQITHRGLRPQLFAVAAGSYTSNAVYGSGAVEIAGSSTAYDGVMNSDLSTISIRQHDTDVVFNVQITLDGSVANPVVDAGEVRIRTLQPLVSTDLYKYSRVLPVPDVNYPLPLFEEVEVLDENGVNLLPSITNGLLQVRLLYGGQLALVQQDLSAGPPPTSAGLTTAQLGGLFGVVNRVIRIIIRGRYRGRIPTPF